MQLDHDRSTRAEFHQNWNPNILLVSKLILTITRSPTTIETINGRMNGMR